MQASLDKVNAVIFYPNKDLILKHSLSLNQKNEHDNNNIKYLHEEYKYRSSKYNNVRELISIRLDLHCSYLILEDYKSPFDNKVNISFDLRTIAAFKLLLNRVVQWFISKEFQDLYMIDKKRRLVLNSDYNLCEKMTSSNKLIMATPTIYYFDEDEYEAINLYIGNTNNVYKLVYEEVLALYDFIKNFNMYQSTLDLLNYVRRPELGKYMVNYNASSKSKTEEHHTKPRKIGNIEYSSGDELDEIFKNKKPKTQVVRTIILNF